MSFLNYLHTKFSVIVPSIYRHINQSGRSGFPDSSGYLVSVTATSPAAAATAVASPVADTAGIADTRILTFLLNPVLHVFLFLFWSLISKYCSPLLISHHLKIFLILLKKFTKKCRGFSQN